MLYHIGNMTTKKKTASVVYILRGKIDTELYLGSCFGVIYKTYGFVFNIYLFILAASGFSYSTWALRCSMQDL